MLEYEIVTTAGANALDERKTKPVLVEILKQIRASASKVNPTGSGSGRVAIQITFKYFGKNYPDTMNINYKVEGGTPVDLDLKSNLTKTTYDLMPGVKPDDFWIEIGKLMVNYVFAVHCELANIFCDEVN